MSQENLQAARKVNEAVRKGDWDTVAAAYDPHVSVRTDPSWPEQQMHGREALLEFFRSGLDVCTSVASRPFVSGPVRSAFI